MLLFYGSKVLWIFLIILCVGDLSDGGLSCFQCTVNHILREKNVQICSHFDESYQYQVYCANSTMCMKRTIYHKLVNGSFIKTSVERGCAKQVHSYKVYDDNTKSWHDEVKIEEKAYRRGCFIEKDKGTPGGPSEYCFCSHNLCNNSQKFHSQTLGFYLIILFNLLMILQGQFNLSNILSSIN